MRVPDTSLDRWTWKQILCRVESNRGVMTAAENYPTSARTCLVNSMVRNNLTSQTLQVINPHELGFTIDRRRRLCVGLGL